MRHRSCVPGNPDGPLWESVGRARYSGYAGRLLLFLLRSALFLELLRAVIVMAAKPATTLFFVLLFTLSMMHWEQLYETRTERRRHP